LIASLVGTGDDAEAVAADQLAIEVDQLVRARLRDDDVVLAPRRPGRPTVPEAWVRSLGSNDPWLAGRSTKPSSRRWRIRCGRGCDRER